MNEPKVCWAKALWCHALPMGTMEFSWLPINKQKWNASIQEFSSEKANPKSMNRRGCWFPLDIALAS